MNKKFLLIVEGEVTEKNILQEVLSRYNYKVVDCGVINITGKISKLDTIKMEAEGDEVFVVQGPRSRIRDWLKLMNRNSDDFERFFVGIEGLFAGIFIIYDVDHTSQEDLLAMFNKYSDETSDGLLLLSSPCIEIIAEPGRTDELVVDHLREYKADINTRLSKAKLGSAKEYIIANFEELAIYYLEKNCKELRSNNVMDHPELILSKINKLNERHDEENNTIVKYRYFTTVLYVCIAYMKQLVNSLNNKDEVKKFFEEQKKKLAKLSDGAGGICADNPVQEKS